MSKVLVISFILLVTFVVAVPSAAEKLGIERNRVSTIGFLVVGVAALYTNLRGFFSLPEYRVLEPLALAVLIFSLRYVVAKALFVTWPYSRLLLHMVSNPCSAFGSHFFR